MTPWATRMRDGVAEAVRDGVGDTTGDAVGVVDPRVYTTRSRGTWPPSLVPKVRPALPPGRPDELEAIVRERIGLPEHRKVRRVSRTQPGVVPTQVVV